MIKGQLLNKQVADKQEAYSTLRQWGIELNETGYCVCPACDFERKKRNEKKLHILFQDTSIVYRCNHCDCSGAILWGDGRYVKEQKQYSKPVFSKRTFTTNEKLYKRFEDRGISQATVDKYKIKLENNNIIFPFYKSGECVNAKTKSFDKKFMMVEKDCEKVLFGMQVADTLKTKDNCIVITEGEEEAMSFTECNIPAVSVPNGANTNKNNLDYINNCYEWLKTWDKYIIATDNDEAGLSLRNDLIKRFGRDKCQIIDYSLFNVKDGNDLLKIDKQLLVKAYDMRENVCPEHILKYKDVFGELDRMYNGEVGQQYFTGWNALDQKLCIKTSNLMVVSGYSGRGKSFFVNNLLFNLTEKNQWKHLLFHFENSVEKHLIELLEMKTRKNFFSSNNRITPEEKDKHKVYLNQFFTFCDNSIRWSVKDICGKIREVVLSEGIKTVVIDPYNRIKKEIEQTELLLIEEMLSSLSSLARELDILVIFIAHPTKPQGTDEQKAPSLYHTAGSQAWYSICDYGVVIHRYQNDQKEYDKQSQVLIQKVKTKDLGEVGKHCLNWERFRLIDKGRADEKY